MTNYVVSTPVNGTFEVPNDLINTTQTSLNLIGQGVTNYGQAVAQNEINLLQSFAGPTPPNQPLIGQLWYNSTMLQLNVYTSIGTWSPLAYEADLANYATVSQLASTNTTLATLASNVVLQPQLSGYVTIAGLYTPPANATAVPIASGGTGITTIGTAGQVLTVNNFGTGLIYASPSNTYQYNILNINQTMALSYTNLGSVCNITTAGVTVTLPQATRCPAGKTLVFTLLVPAGGVAYLTAYSTDQITSGPDLVQTTYNLYAGEEIQLISNGINGWSMMSASKVTGITPNPGDNSINLATTAFVTTALTDGAISPSFNMAATGSQFTTGYSFTGDGDNDTGMFSPSDGDLHLYSNGTNMVDINVSTGITFYASTVVNGTLSVTGVATGITPAAGDSSTKFATTAFVTTALNNKLPFTPVQQGGGVNQLANKVYIGWSGTQLLCTVDATNLGNILIAADFNNLQGQITNNLTNQNNENAYLQSQITNNVNNQNSENSNLQNQITNNTNNLQNNINNLANSVSAVVSPNTTGGYGIGNYQLVEQGSAGGRGSYVSPLMGQGPEIAGGTWMNCGGGQTDNNNWDLWVRIA
jgi:hypothetical protein